MRNIKKKLLAVPWWCFPFVAFGAWDMNNEGINDTNMLVAIVPLAIGIFFFIWRLVTTEPAKDLKRKRI